MNPFVKRYWFLAGFASSAMLFGAVEGQTWCGKNYMSTEPVTNPGGQFPASLTSSKPLLALRCGPAVKPYLPEDLHSETEDPTFVSILIDTAITYTNVSGATPITLPPKPSDLSVTITIDGHYLTSGSVPLNATKHPLPFSLSTLSPRTKAYTITCTARLPGGPGGTQEFSTENLLTYLPPKPDDIGAVTKMDMRSGSLLAKPVGMGIGGSEAYERVFPMGFYTQYGSYLAVNLSVERVLSEQGFTVVHPVPSFDNITVLDEVLDAMQEAGLYLMYDMRNTYMNDTSVIEQVNHIKKRPNLLLWYTADEPDGTSDPLNATLHSKNLINTLDGGDGQGGSGYHPVSLVLNCENYFFSEYSSGADVLLQDTYMIGNNVTFSTVWGTPCTEDYGDCGCDNCKGSFEDIATRMDEFYERLFVNGWELDKVVWTVPQGFGNESYWSRYPTGKEFVVQSIVGINHGGLGVVSWDDPTPADIKDSASALAKSLGPSGNMSSFILDPTATVKQITTNGGIDAGLWTVGQNTLLLATNMNYESVALNLSEVGFEMNEVKDVVQVFDGGASIGEGGGGGVILFEEVGSGGFVFVLG